MWSTDEAGTADTGVVGSCYAAGVCLEFLSLASSYADCYEGTIRAVVGDLEAAEGLLLCSETVGFLEFGDEIVGVAITRSCTAIGYYCA